MSDIQLNDELATKIIEAAIPLGAYDGDEVPDTEKAREQVATEIIDVCQEFWGNGYRGDDVKSLLIVAGALDGPAPSEPTPAAEAVPADPPAAAQEDQTPVEAPAEAEEEPPAEDGPAPQEPWDGYANDTIAKIKQFINDNREHVDEEVVASLIAYEEVNKARATLLKFFAELNGDTSEDERHQELDEQAQAAADRDPDPEPEEPKSLVQQEAEASVALDKGDVQTVAVPNGDEPVSTEARHDGALNGAEKALDEEHHLPGVGERKQEYARSQIAAARAERERLPVPPEPHHTDDPELPADLDALSGDQVNQLMVDFTACLTRATWLAACARIDHRHASRILSREQAKAYRFAAGIKDEDTQKYLPEWKVKIEADADDEVLKWHEIVEDAKDAVQSFESLRDSYQAAIDTLSRVEGFRREESRRAR